MKDSFSREKHVLIPEKKSITSTVTTVYTIREITWKYHQIENNGCSGLSLNNILQDFMFVYEL